MVLVASMTVYMYRIMMAINNRQGRCRIDFIACMME